MPSSGGQQGGQAQGGGQGGQGSVGPPPGPRGEKGEKGDKGDPGAGADVLLPAHGDYPATTLTARVESLIDRKAEEDQPDFALWFENRLS